METACEVCGQTFLQPGSQVGRVVTCSSGCSHLLRSTRIKREQGPLPDLPDRTAPSYPSVRREVRTCTICGGGFLAAPKAIVRTCSKGCDSEWRTRVQTKLTPKLCEECGESFKPRTAVARFCSHDCRLAALNALPRYIKPMDERVRTVDPKGYVRISVHGRGPMFEHRYVMEQHIGRKLRGKEVVHHVNGDRADNRIENLELFASHADHLRSHHDTAKNFT